MNTAGKISCQLLAGNWNESIRRGEWLVGWFSMIDMGEGRERRGEEIVWILFNLFSTFRCYTTDMIDSAKEIHYLPTLPFNQLHHIPHTYRLDGLVTLFLLLRN